MRTILLIATGIFFYLLARPVWAGGELMPEMEENTCQQITGYDFDGWRVIEHSQMIEKNKELALGRIQTRREPTLICRVSVKTRTICNQIGVTPKGPITECLTIEGKRDGEEVRYQRWWRVKK